MPTHQIPDQMPILSAGKHRNPRKGACFMELASFLAGERWSDSPACTHPLLAALARHVNDLTSDAGRGRLGVLIPSVIGLTGDDPRIDVRIALRSARAALPVAAAERQRVMALGILKCERLLDDLDRRPQGHLEEASQQALQQVPAVAAWVRAHVTGAPTSLAAFRRRAAPHIVAAAVEGIARACIVDPDARLHDLLVETIAECRLLAQPEREPVIPVAAAAWDDACRLTRAGRRR